MSRIKLDVSSLKQFDEVDLEVKSSEPYRAGMLAFGITALVALLGLAITVPYVVSELRAEGAGQTTIKKEANHGR